MTLSPCGRFLVLEALHIDRDVMHALATWSERRGLRIQDAVQLAILFFTEHALHADTTLAPPRAVQLEHTD